MSQSEMLQALKRPLDHDELSSRQQWSIDAGLGILDWAPNQAESDEYCRLRAAMGDKACLKWLAKQKEKVAG